MGETELTKMRLLGPRVVTKQVPVPRDPTQVQGPPETRVRPDVECPWLPTHRPERCGHSGFPPIYLPSSL